MWANASAEATKKASVGVSDGREAVLERSSPHDVDAVDVDGADLVMRPTFQ